MAEKKEATGKRQAYLQKLEGRLAEWNAKVDQLKARAQQASADAKIRYHQEIEDVKAKREQLEAQLRHLRDVSEAKFDEAKLKAEAAWIDFRGRVEMAMARIK